MDDDGSVLAQAAAWIEAGMPAALATVVSTWGSAPRPVGSHMAVAGDGAFLGSISGGCVEAAVVREALDVLAECRPRLLRFGISTEQAWEVGLACGGIIEILVEPIQSKRAPLSHLTAPARSLAVVTLLDGGTQAVVTADRIEGELALDEPSLALVRRRLTEAGSGTFETTRGRAFMRAYTPPRRLFLVGAVHIAQPLAPMAAACGWAVTIIDPRRAFATPERFPSLTLRHDYPDEAFAELGLNATDAVAALTHDPKIDDPALAAALRSPAFYIGALGSRRTHAQRLERLTARGFTADQLARIHGPIGLHLGGRQPAEIAVGILAQILHRRYRETRP